MTGACMMCGAPGAARGRGWPGFRRDHPDAVRGKSIRICAFGGECEAQAIARAVRAAKRPWPWRGEDADLRARVAAILGEAAPVAAKAAPPPPMQPAFL